MSEEVWKDVTGYEGIYQVSNLGRVKALLREKILPFHNTSNGYFQVHLYRKGVVKYAYVHRVVAEAFCDNGRCLNEVNHIDGDKKNNAASNLEWCTRSENHNTPIYIKRQRDSKRAKMKPVVQLDSLGKVIGKFDCIHEAYRRTGITRTSIRRSCENPKIHPYGYSWRYEQLQDFREGGDAK